MAYVSVDVDLSDFSDRDVAAYVAGKDDLWAKCIAARDAELARRGAGSRAELERAWRDAQADGLIRVGG